MPKPYSVDLRARVIEEAETGVSRREAAERYGISPSVVVSGCSVSRRPAALRQGQAVAAPRRWSSTRSFC